MRRFRPNRRKFWLPAADPGGWSCIIGCGTRPSGHPLRKSNELGGALKAERGIPFKKDLFGFIATKKLLLEKAGVEVRLNTEVTPEYCEILKPDALVIAVGAEPIIPPIPGIDRTNVIVANYLPENHEKVGQKVVILGGGLVGCETAVHLAQEGKDVTVVEMLNDVCADANGRHRPLLMAQLNRLVTIKTNMRGVRVTEEGLVCADKEAMKR